MLHLCLCAYLKVISGSNLPVPRSGKALDPFVRVEIHGIASDSQRKNTHHVKHSCKYSHKLYRGFVSTCSVLLCQTWIYFHQSKTDFVRFLSVCVRYS